MRRWLTCLLVAAWAIPASAAESVPSLSKKLVSSDDFRVRTQAALALGASDSGKAVDPLCKGLDDSNETVRAAAAAALGKLGKGGKSCLSRRLGRESSANVKKMIKKAVGLVDLAAAGPALSPSTRYYIAVGKTHALGTGKDVDGTLQSALRKAAAPGRGYVVATPGENAEAAQRRLRKFPSVIGLSFEPSVIVQRDGRNITVRLVLLIQQYPQGGSIGRVERSAGFTTTQNLSDEKRDELVERLCKEAMREFDRLAAQL